MQQLVRIHDPRLTLDEAEQICRVTLLFNLVAITFIGLFGAIAAYTDARSYALILMGVMFLALTNIACFLIWRRMQQLVLTTCLGYLAFCLYLQISGGQNNSGILWHFVYPIMVYYIAGLRLGCLSSGLLIASETLLMQLDHLSFHQAQYSPEFKMRFLCSMTVMSIMGAMLEHSRNKAQKSLMILARRLHHASQTDELTGLPNRRALHETLQDLSVRAERTQGDFVVLLCDIDYFKGVNDQHGHAVGDQALRHLAKNLSTVIRKSDSLARWGGEEFMLVLPDTDLASGIIMAERVRTSAEENPLVTEAGVTVRLTLSCGLANWLECKNLDQLFSLADDRLYQAKATGRNQVVA